MNNASIPRRLVLLLCWVAVAVGGLALQMVVQPPPPHGITGLAPLGPVFFCALVWLTALLYLGGFLLFGSRWCWWHGLVFVGCGAAAGFSDGFVFAFLFGAAIGMFCGVVLGGSVFVLRYFTRAA